MNNPVPQPSARRIVIVGAGHGGGSLAALLRQYGFGGAITLIGAEELAPYQRPPLSKAWLTGAVGAAGLALKPSAFYDEQGIALHLGTDATAIDTTARQLMLKDGRGVPYDDLVLATGASARMLPLFDSACDNVITLRTMADGGRLRARLGPGQRLLVIGGGYVGLECAATARALGAEVVVLERAARLLERVASVPIASFLQKHHEQQGVRFALNAALEAVEENTGPDGARQVAAVRLADGSRFPCDLVLVGVGAAPASGLAQAAGLACDDGILVDADCRTSDAHIFAIGDVARRPHPLYQRNLRLESVPSTIEQAKRVAAVLTGREPGAAEVPWFWSDQYKLKLQIGGLPFDADRLTVRGDPETGSFAVFHTRAGRVVTVEAINAPLDFFAGKKLIGSGKNIPLSQLGDTSIPPNQLAA